MKETIKTEGRTKIKYIDKEDLRNIEAKKAGFSLNAQILANVYGTLNELHCCSFFRMPSIH